jgi:phage terminase large subunit-like protein
LPRGFASNGDRVAWFVENYCTHAKGEWFGRSLQLEPWQRWMLELIFEVDKSSGLRRWRNILLMLPRKQGKSTLIAALGYYFLVFDSEGGPEVYSAAWGESQARNVFDAARTMHDSSPMLQRTTQKFAKAITCPENAGSWRVVSRLADMQQGTNPHAALIDELHVHARGDLLDAFRRGQQARRQPVLLNISTEGSSRYNPLGELERGFYTDAVIDELTPYLQVGRHDESRSLMIRYGVPWGTEVDADDPSVVRGCNPASWIDPDRLVGEYLNAPGSREADFRRYHLNELVENDGGEGVPMHMWDECVDTELELVNGQDVVLAIDAGYRRDCSAVVIAGKHPSGRAVVRSWIWKPPRDQGLELDLEATIGRRVEELLEQYRVRRIVGDPALLVTLFQRWQGRGLPIREYRFGWGDTGPDSVRLLEAIQSQQLAHNGDATLRLHVSNMRVKEGPNGLWRYHDHPDKRRPDSDVPNDAGIALMMVIGELLGGEPGTKWKGRGLLVV